MKKLPILLVLAFATGAQAQTLEDAVAAYQKGELETAAQQFAALAEAGDAKAQYNLAVLYEKGEGVAQEMRKLDDLTRVITESMNEMASGAVQINNAVQEVSEITQKNKRSIENLASEVSKFKVM